MTDERNAPQGFRKYGTPVPVRQGDTPPNEDDATEELPPRRQDDPQGSDSSSGEL